MIGPGLTKAVYEALNKEPGLTTREVRQRVRPVRSHTAIGQACRQVAEPVGNRPARWYVKTPTRPTHAQPEACGPLRLSTEILDLDVLLAIKTAGDWPGLWAASRAQFTASLAALSLHADADPEMLYTNFCTAAQSLASIAYALRQVIGRPDWYEALRTGEHHEAND